MESLTGSCVYQFKIIVAGVFLTKKKIKIKAEFHTAQSLTKSLKMAYQF